MDNWEREQLTIIMSAAELLLDRLPVEPVQPLSPSVLVLDILAAARHMTEGPPQSREANSTAAAANPRPVQASAESPGTEPSPDPE